MTPSEQQTAYRSKCLYARKGASIFHVKDGKVGELYETYSSVNAAKNWSHLQPAGTVYVIR